MKHIDDLKNALLTLNPSGDEGFEELIRRIFSDITDFSFRRAGSGPQFGIDGKSVTGNDDICFECKRYDGDIDRNKILSKIMDLSRYDSRADIWVLCATSPIRTQIQDDLRYHSEKRGLPILILDWEDGLTPPLAVLLAMGGHQSDEFFEVHLSKDIFNNVMSALESIRQEADFELKADWIKTSITDPSLALAMAKRSNEQWLERVFANKKSAKIYFGQALCPKDAGKITPIVRKDLCSEVQTHMATLDERPLFILGDEGCGKSWLAIQSWMEAKSKPLLIITTPSMFQNVSQGDSFKNILIKQLITQTGVEFSQECRQRWLRLFERLRQNISGLACPNFVVVIDGINQRQRLEWVRIIEYFATEVGKLGGRLIITCRSHYYNAFVGNYLEDKPCKLEVKPWTLDELKDILKGCEIEPSKVNSRVLDSLRNPRLLGIAIDLLGENQIESLDELNVSRLLFEHIRHSAKNSYEPQSVHKFVKTLQDHAEEILERIDRKQLDDLKIFDDTGNVAGGRFYHPVEGDPGKYELHDDGLTLALAFAILDGLRIAKRNARSLDDELAIIIEPISALDLTAQVLAAAVLVSCIDDSQPVEIASSLISAFAKIQNPDDNDYPPFVSLVRHRPMAFFAPVRELLLSGDHVSSLGWIQDVLLETSLNQEVWGMMHESIKEWFTLHTLEPVNVRREWSNSKTQEEFKEKQEQERKSINDKLASLSSVEQDVLTELKLCKGDISKLIRFALDLMAGKPLAPFAHHIMLWTFSANLNASIYRPQEELIQLARFNRVDWLEMRDALLTQAALFQQPEISDVGRWALVVLLYSTGQTEDAARAEKIYEELTRNRMSK